MSCAEFRGPLPIVEAEVDDPQAAGDAGRLEGIHRGPYGELPAATATLAHWLASSGWSGRPSTSHPLSAVRRGCRPARAAGLPVVDRAADLVTELQQPIGMTGQAGSTSAIRIRLLMRPLDS